MPDDADDGPLELLYGDDHLVAIAKPAGLLVHRSELDRHETRFAMQMLRDQLGRHVYPAHRLDRGTSGVLVFALDRDTARALAGAFEDRRVDKSYLAVVRGWPPVAGRLERALVRRRDPAEYVAAGGGRSDAAAPAQAAATQWRTLAMTEVDLAVDRYPTTRLALLELEPETGRRHQLRRHLKHLAYPIIGDATYGKGRLNRLFAERFDCSRLLLHCARLGFAHPADGRPICIEAPLPAPLPELFARLGWPATLPIPRACGPDA